MIRAAFALLAASSTAFADAPPAFRLGEKDRLAFSRGERGWAAFNNGTADKRIRVQTGLPKGTYCDTVHDTRGGSCTGPRVRVNSTGFASVVVRAKDAVAFTRADRL